MTSTPAQDLMRAYNRACRVGGLAGGQLAYSAAGPGEWFSAGDRPQCPTLSVRFGGRLTLRRAQELIDEVTSHVWVLEFAAASVGMARDIVRQNTPRGMMVPDVQVQGRLGYEVTSDSYAWQMSLRTHLTGLGFGSILERRTA